MHLDYSNEFIHRGFDRHLVMADATSYHFTIITSSTYHTHIHYFHDSPYLKLFGLHGNIHCMMPDADDFDNTDTKTVIEILCVSAIDSSWWRY